MDEHIEREEAHCSISVELALVNRRGSQGRVEDEESSGEGTGGGGEKRSMSLLLPSSQAHD